MVYSEQDNKNKLLKKKREIILEGAKFVEEQQMKQRIIFEDNLILEINKFNYSTQNITEIKSVYNHETKNRKTKGKNYKLFNSLIFSRDTISVLRVTSNCVSLSVTGESIVVEFITISVGAGLCIFGDLVEEYLKRKEQHNI